MGLGGWYSLWLLARVTRRQLSPLLIGALMALALVAPFSIAERMLAMTAALLTAVTGVLTPFATALHATDQNDRQRRLFLVGGRHAAAFATFLIVGLLVLGGSFINLWIGPTFAEAALLLTILAVGELLPSTQYVTNGVLVATARH
jgi:O-antigen/teichoic acid export membrane protein